MRTDGATELDGGGEKFAKTDILRPRLPTRFAKGADYTVSNHF